MKLIMEYLSKSRSDLRKNIQLENCSWCIKSLSINIALSMDLNLLWQAFIHPASRLLFSAALSQDGTDPYCSVSLFISHTCMRNCALVGSWLFTHLVRLNTNLLPVYFYPKVLFLIFKVWWVILALSLVMFSLYSRARHLVPHMNIKNTHTTEMQRCTKNSAGFK